jgi:hypothetical protein
LTEALGGDLAFVAGPSGQVGSLPAEIASSHQAALLLQLKDATTSARQVESLLQHVAAVLGERSFELSGRRWYRGTVATLPVVSAVVDDVLVVSTSEALLADVLRVGRTHDGSSLADDAGLKARLAALPAGSQVVSHVDTAQQLADTLTALGAVGRRQVGCPQRDAGTLTPFSPRPSAP